MAEDWELVIEPIEATHVFWRHGAEKRREAVYDRRLTEDEIQQLKTMRPDAVACESLIV